MFVARYPVEGLPLYPIVIRKLCEQQLSLNSVFHIGTWGIQEQGGGCGWETGSKRKKRPDKYRPLIAPNSTNEISQTLNSKVSST